MPIYDASCIHRSHLHFLITTWFRISMVPSHCFETASTLELKCGNTAKISAVLFKLTCTFSDLMCLCVPELSTICIPNLQDYHISEKWFQQAPPRLKVLTDRFRFECITHPKEGILKTTCSEFFSCFPLSECAMSRTAAWRQCENTLWVSRQHNKKSPSQILRSCSSFHPAPLHSFSSRQFFGSLVL